MSINEIKQLIEKSKYSCYYTDKFSDFIDDLEEIIDRIEKKGD